MLPPPAEKLQNFFGVFLQFQIGVDSRIEYEAAKAYGLEIIYENDVEDGNGDG